MNILATLQQAAQLHQQGHLDQAQVMYEQILKHDKNQSDAHNLLGALFISQKDFKQAEKHLLKAIKLSPNFAPIYYNLGKCYLGMKLPKKAYVPMQKAHQMNSNDMYALYDLANIEIQLGQHLKAIALYKVFVKHYPNNVEACTNLANAYYELKDHDQAMSWYKHALSVQDKHLPAILGLSSTLAELDRQQDAIKLLNEAQKDQPDALLCRRQGTYYQQDGFMDEARQAYLQAIELNPTYGQAYKGYSQVTKIKTPEQAAIIMQGLNALEDMSATEQKHYYFALGNAHDSLKNYPEAITYYNKGNYLHRQSYSYKTSDNKELFETIKKAYNKDWFNSLTGDAFSEQKMIFIVGMPRSGTTLVEQIISSHSDVVGAGELDYIGDFSKESSFGAKRFHQHFVNMDISEWQQMALDYVKKVTNFVTINPYTKALNPDRLGKRVTDKMPHNFLYLGMIMALFPNAKIIHCKRHPVANCLSIYKQLFASKHGHKYAYQQAELAQYHNLYQGLMQHWREVMPERFYENKYEDLTTNQEAESRRLIEYCGLPWQEACLDFYKTKRQVKTASAFQVRQPMSTQSVDLWKRYGEGLQPLIEHLDITAEYAASADNL